MHYGWTIRRQYELEGPRLIGTTMINTSFNAPKTAVQAKNWFYLPAIDGEKNQSGERTTFEEMEAMRQRLSKELGRELHFVKTAEA